MRYRPKKRSAATSNAITKAGRTSRLTISLRLMSMRSITKAGYWPNSNRSSATLGRNAKPIGPSSENSKPHRLRGMSPDEGEHEIVNPGANTEAVFQHQLPDSQIESPTSKNFSLVESVLSH